MRVETGEGDRAIGAKVVVVKTQEEREIAREVAGILGQ